MPFVCRVGMSVLVRRVMPVLVAVPRAIGMNVFMAVPVPGVAAFELHFIGAAAACGAHSGLLVRLGRRMPALPVAARGCGFHVTSSSLTRISVPPVTCI